MGFPRFLTTTLENNKPNIVSEDMNFLMVVFCDNIIGRVVTFTRF